MQTAAKRVNRETSMHSTTLQECPLMNHRLHICTMMAVIRHWCCWALISSQVNWSNFTEALIRYLGHWEARARGTNPLKLLLTLWICEEKQMEELNISVELRSNSLKTIKDRTEKFPHPVTYRQLLLYTHTQIYKKYKASRQSHFKSKSLVLWHTENSNGDYTSSVEGFMNTM